MPAKTIADLPIWQVEPPQRHDVELTTREVAVINHLRSIESDETFTTVVDMIGAMVTFYNRSKKASSL